MVAVAASGLAWLRTGLLTSALLHQWSADWAQSRPWLPHTTSNRATPRPLRVRHRSPVSATPAAVAWASREHTVGARGSAYGIPRGAWIPVVLMHAITHTDEHQVVVRVRAEVSGRRRRLPEGTAFSVRMAPRVRLDRLDGVATRGVTPSGEVLRCAASLYDRNLRLGLPAIVGSRGRWDDGWARWVARRLSAMTPTELPPELDRWFRPEAALVAAPRGSVYVAPQPAYLQVLRGC